MAKKRKIHVVISDSRPILRAGLRKLLASEPDFTVVGEAQTGREILALVRELKPEVLLAEGPLVAQNHQEHNVLRELEEKHKKTRVIVLASSQKEEGAVRTIWHAVEVFPKHAPFRLLIEYLHHLEPRIPAPVAAQGAYAEKLPSPPFPFPSEIRNASSLSTRERQVVELVAQGFKNKEVADRMFISEQTVKNHLHNIFDKLGVSDRLELVLHAIHKNLQAPA
ncbi:MAG: response regulator transcription factor [Acidobacteria bacterium]|nr:response regulator transcription factor [Acidobacteriota bacterium]